MAKPKGPVRNISIKDILDLVEGDSDKAEAFIDGQLLQWDAVIIDATISIRVHKRLHNEVDQFEKRIEEAEKAKTELNLMKKELADYLERDIPGIMENE